MNLVSMYFVIDETSQRLSFNVFEYDIINGKLRYVEEIKYYLIYIRYIK